MVVVPRRCILVTTSNHGLLGIQKGHPSRTRKRRREGWPFSMPQGLLGEGLRLVDAGQRMLSSKEGERLADTG